MPDAPRDRPAGSAVLLSLSGFVSADSDSVFDAMLKRVNRADGATPNVFIDPSSRTIVLQGDWWYRGEWRVSREAAGSEIEFEIVNVAPRFRWAGRMAARKTIATAPASFESVVESVRDEVE